MTAGVDLSTIPARSIPTYNELSYDDYLNNHVLPNRPFILSAKTTSSWASTQWRLPPINNTTTGTTPSVTKSTSTCSKPNLAALRGYAHHVVPVADTTTRQYSEFARSDRCLGDVLDLWEGGSGEGLYVKDWHLMAGIECEGGGVGEVYEVPECFRDDWLSPPYTPSPPDDTMTEPTPQENHDLRAGEDGSERRPPLDATSAEDFRFCYLGPRGTFTPMHRDVYCSYSWSANVLGRKIWWLFPPTQLRGLVEEDEVAVFDVRTLPDEGGGIKVLQQEGEVIWVPSGWYHQVLNIDFCISFNHNFISSPTLPLAFESLVKGQKRVEGSISDVKLMIQERLGTGPGSTWEKEWSEEVQGLLARDAGWGWSGFWDMVERNVIRPPAEAELSPGLEVRDEFVREVIGRYRGLREWHLLDQVRETVLRIEGVIGPG